MRRTSWLRIVYIVLSYLLVPLLLVHLYWRSLSAPAYRQRIGERFGLGLARQRRPSIWVHAVSVGEVQAAAPLVRALLKRHPGVPLVMTTMTPTGSARVRLLFGDAVVHSYVPYDLAAPVRWFFDRARPSLAIIMETELWPNLYHECGERRVPLVLASARISARSLGRYRRLLPLFRDTLANGIVIAAQTPADAERFRSLGANPAQTHVTGNIKFDFELPSDVLHAGRALRKLQAAERPVWVAASTHEGEEALLLAAHMLIRQQHPRAMLFLVPRHPERFAVVAALIDSFGLTGCEPQILHSFSKVIGLGFCKRSRPSAPRPPILGEVVDSSPQSWGVRGAGVNASRLLYASLRPLWHSVGEWTEC